MSIIMKIVEAAAQLLPDGDPDSLRQKQGSYIGAPVNRIDGELKVTGEAKFSAEYKFENLAYAALVCSTIAKGKITKINVAEAEQADGVLAVITHKNAPSMKNPLVFSPGSFREGTAGSDLPVLGDETIHWDGQPVAIVVAETLDQAEYAALRVHVEYTAEDAKNSFEAAKTEAEAPANVMFESPKVKIGAAEDNLREAEFTVDNIYSTPRYNHNAIEPHATVALWERDGSLLVYDSAQYVYGVKNTLAEIFSLKPEKVRVLAAFVGGGFGGKGNLWNNTILCAAAAKIVNRPVQLALSREAVYRLVGGRSLTEQRVALGARRDGKLTALIHTGISATTKRGAFTDPYTFPARHLYAADNIYINQNVVYLDTVTNTSMRGPGHAPGSFALESAIDELAFKLDIDPIELRRINEPNRDPTKNVEFSLRNLTESYRRGAEKFGWKKAAPRTQRDGRWLVGQGVATANYHVRRFPAAARVRIYKDGTALVQSSAQEMGMGTATVQIQHAAERLGLPMEKVRFEYGDSDLPKCSPAGASNQTVSLVLAVKKACEKLQRKILSLASDDSAQSLAGLKFKEIESRDGGLFSKTNLRQGETYAQILERLKLDYVEAEAKTGLPFETMKRSMHSYGAQFCEVRVHEETGEIRVSRFLGSFDCGRILNAKTATSQFRGGIVMGIGMALMEETLFDERRGRIINPSLAEYHVPVHMDIPKIDIIYTDIPDKHTPLGAHGIGEIGITGVAAAIANAIFNATGKRIRSLPITIDKLL